MLIEILVLRDVEVKSFAPMKQGRFTWKWVKMRKKFRIV